MKGVIPYLFLFMGMPPLAHAVSTLEEEDRFFSAIKTLSLANSDSFLTLARYTYLYGESQKELFPLSTKQQNIRIAVDTRRYILQSTNRRVPPVVIIFVDQSLDGAVSPNDVMVFGTRGQSVLMVTMYNSKIVCHVEGVGKDCKEAWAIYQSILFEHWLEYMSS